MHGHALGGGAGLVACCDIVLAEPDTSFSFSEVKLGLIPSVISPFALAKIGAVMVPINTRFRTNDLDYVLRQSDSCFLITHDTSGPIGYLEMVREVISLSNTGDSVDDPSFPKLRRGKLYPIGLPFGKSTLLLST